MKHDINFKKFLFVVLSVGLLLIMGGTGYAVVYDCQECHADSPWKILTDSFHSAAGLICAKCHTMHASEDGVLPTMPDEPGGTPEGPNPHLLYKASITDLCLVCHKAPFNGTGAPIVMTTNGDMGTNYPFLPGGDYYYSKTAQDQRNGHNPGGVVIGSDSILTLSPGGEFPSSDESCTSCHEAHAGSPANEYRLLKKKPAGWTGADLLVTGDTRHSGSDEDESFWPGGYYSGFSDWCGACHSNPDDTGTGFHGSAKTDDDVGDGTNWIRHPSDLALGSVIAGNYGSSLNLQSPIQDINEDGDVDSTDEVFCLSCHRVHATEYFNSTRWDNSQPSGTGGCNNCHAKGS